MALEKALRSLFEVNMGIRPGEKILVFTDTLRPDETPSEADRHRRERLFAVAGETAAFAGRTYGNAHLVTFPSTAASGAEPPEELWHAALGELFVETLKGEAIFDPLLRKEAGPGQVARALEVAAASREEAAQVIIALSNNSTSHTNFRTLANAAGARFASLPHFDPDMFFTSMLVDWNVLSDRTRKLAEIIHAAVTIRITTPNGTDITLGKEGRPAKPDDGILTEPGSFGNLPAGEVFLAPLEGTARGKLVLEYAPMRRLETPLELVVRDGVVAEIVGDEPYREKLEKKFAESADNRNIAELGIGTNDKATRPDNILETEKILGTIHIALGDNRGFGGTVSTPFHEDYIFYTPTLTAIHADGTERTVLAAGKLLL
jgi:aminopeptidase